MHIVHKLGFSLEPMKDGVFATSDKHPNIRVKKVSYYHYEPFLTLMFGIIYLKYTRNLFGLDLSEKRGGKKVFKPMILKEGLTLVNIY